MLNVQSRRRGSGSGFGSYSHTLSVSWLGKRFRALAIHRGQIQSAWECPDPVEGTHRFTELLERAVATTGYSGETVSLVLAHPRLAHQLVEVPPAKGAELTKLLERAAQQQSGPLFTTKASWSAYPVESIKGTPRFLLNLFPKPLLEELLAGARKANLFLTGVFPPTAVLQQQLQELPNPEADVVMLAADTGGATTVVVGHSDGRVLLARALAGNWNDSLPTLALDLRRTMLFVNQQHSTDVRALYLFGSGAAERAAELQAQVGLPTRPSPADLHPDYWARTVLRVPPAAAQNFVSREQQMAPQRHRFAWVVGSATALSALACLAVAYSLHRIRTAELANLEGLRAQTAQLQARHRELQELQQAAAQQRELVDRVAANRPPPVAAWALGYLADAVPHELVVTNFLVRREEDVWRLRLAGVPQPPATNGPASIQAAVATLTNRLATGPLRLQLPGSPVPERARTNVATEGPSPKPVDWVFSLSEATPVESTPARGFVIEGWMQP